MRRINPKYPVFVPTKGRYDSLQTIGMFERIGVPYKAVIEAQEFDNYAAVISEKNIIVLPHRDKGLTVTRNWIWDYALEKGYKRFWTFDDNISHIYRLNRNIYHPVGDGTVLTCIEDFTDRYTNAVITGMNYDMFVMRKERTPVFYLNTRVYSNMLIKTDIPYRNELFYNDDTDLCIRVLKDGYCTVLFNAFLINKATTMKLSGGMTEYYKQTNNRKEFVIELQKAHPHIVQLTQKFGRWHHHVNYDIFKKNKLEKKPGLIVPKGVDNYGMVLTKKEK